MEYLLYLRSKALEDDSLDSFKAFSSAVHRCVVAVDCVRALPNICTDSDKSMTFHEDYTFHDQVDGITCTVSCIMMILFKLR